MTDKQTLLLIFGGESAEHDVSIISASNVYRAINREKYAVSLVYIDRDGRWWSMPEWSDDPVNAERDEVMIAPNDNGLRTSAGEIIKPDVAFPILHGKNGEDGTVQGLLQLVHVPCVGPSLLAAGVTMDKDMTKRLAEKVGVPVAPWVLWRRDEPKPDFAETSRQLGLSMFVKPSRAGSSAGVSKVESENDWQSALDNAAEFDSEILIEQAVSGNEFQVAVLGNDNPDVSQVCEIVIGASFHDFEDKYSADSSAQFYIPARLDEDATQQVRDFAKKVYQATAGRGMARVDFFIDEAGKIYLNEINSIPGFTNMSVYPKLWGAQGVGYDELVDRLISLALKK